MRVDWVSVAGCLGALLFCLFAWALLIVAILYWVDRV